MFNRIVMTAGVSAMFTGGNLLAETLQDLWKGTSLDDQKPFDQEAVKDLFHDHQHAIKEQEEIVRSKPASVSVELSLLSALNERNQLASSPKVSLLTSSTNSGYYVSLVNAFILEQMYGADVTIDLVDELRVDSTIDMKNMLGKFMDKVYQRLAEGEPSTTCFAAVGGYKIMTTYGTFIGSMMGFPTCYMHERSKFLHVIPPTPIDLPESFVRENQALLRTVFQENVVPLSGLTEEEQAIVSGYPSVFQTERIDEDGKEETLVSLTLMAEFLLQRGELRFYIHPSVYLSQDALKTFRSEGNRKKWVEGELKTMLSKPEGAYDFYHDKEFKMLDRKKMENNLYKSPDQNQVFRCTWFKIGKELFIEKIWTDHDVYEREASRGVGLYTRSSMKDFEKYHIE